MFLPPWTKVTGYSADVTGLFEYFPFDPDAVLTRWTRGCVQFAPCVRWVRFTPEAATFSSFTFILTIGIYQYRTISSVSHATEAIVNIFLNFKMSNIILLYSLVHFSLSNSNNKTCKKSKGENLLRWYIA